jgi:hypothetical protein
MSNSQAFSSCFFVSFVIQGLRPAQAYENRFFDLVVKARILVKSEKSPALMHRASRSPKNKT